jgi:hypothetical protein
MSLSQRGKMRISPAPNRKGQLMTEQHKASNRHARLKPTTNKLHQAKISSHEDQPRCTKWPTRPRKRNRKDVTRKSTRQQAKRVGKVQEGRTRLVSLSSSSAPWRDGWFSSSGAGECGQRGGLRWLLY